jgi:3-hydroxyisobutyrate dehydrogenase
MKPTNVAFLGLGLMGSGMAARLLGAGYSLSVYNRTRAKAEPLAGLGATLADSPAQAVAEAEIIFSMLADDAACRTIWLGPGGALAAAPTDAVLVESSTVTVGWIEELNKAAESRGLALIDAPVTGSKPQAAAGQLLFLVGGSARALEKIRPALLSMGRDAIHLGPTGSGARMKLINNFLCGVQLASLAEGLAMIERSGLDPARAVSVITQGAPGSPLVNGVSARMMQQEYAPNFALNLMAKDLRYAAQEGAQQGIDAITADAALRVFENAIAAGYGEKDIAAVVEQFRDDR